MQHNPIYSIPIKLLFLLNISFINTQAQSTFQIAYPLDSAYIHSISILQTADGGFIISSLADTNVHTINDYDGCILKTDSVGNIEWNTFVGGDYFQSAIDAVELPSGNIAFTGEINFDSLTNRRKVLAGMLSSTGNLLWTKYYDIGLGLSIIKTNDNHLMIGASGGTCKLIKIDTLGNVIWSKLYGNASDYGLLYRVIQTADGGYAFTGYFVDANTGNQLSWLVKTNADGDTLFSRTAGFGVFSEGIQLIETPQHDLVISGNTQNIDGNSDIDILLMKYSASGNLLWSTVYYSPLQELSYGLSYAPDSSYLLFGTAINPSTGEFNAFLLNVDVNGDTLWSQLYDKAFDILSVTSTANGDIAGTGFSYDGLYIMRTDANGNYPCATQSPGFIILDTLIQEFSLAIGVADSIPVTDTASVLVYGNILGQLDICSTSSINELKEINYVDVFPNPSAGTFTISATSSEAIGELIIYNMFGDKVYSASLNQETRKEIILNHIAPGIYFIHTQNGEKHLVKKLIVSDN